MSERGPEEGGGGEEVHCESAIEREVYYSNLQDRLTLRMRDVELFLSEMANKKLFCSRCFEIPKKFVPKTRLNRYLKKESGDSECKK